MPRPIWTGSLSFGLVNVPVSLYAAVRDRGVHFRQLHEPDRSPVATRRVCAQENTEVPWEEIVKGYELDGKLVLVTDEDLQAASPRRSKTIDIEHFVQEREIDPIYFDHPYLLVPSDEGAARAYELLGEAMSRSGKVAVGRFVLRASEQLVNIRSRDGLLTLTTMLFHDEVRGRQEISEEVTARAPARKEVENALAIIGELEVPFEPESYRDEHRAHLQRIIKRKQKHQKIAAPPPEQPQPAMSAPDLMGALEQSLAQIREGRAAGQAKTSRRKGAGAASARSSRPERSRG